MKKIIVLGLLFVMLFGCIGGGEQPPANDTNVTPPEPVVELPSFTIVSPDENEVMLTFEDTAAVEVITSTKNLVLKQGGAKKIGEGHFVFTVDDGDSSSAYQKTFVLEGVAVGEHVLKVELVHNDGSSYSPKISKSVKFYVEKEITEYIPAEHVVKIKDFAYEPETITVNAGDTVTWINEGAYPRSATCLPYFDTEVLGPGANASVVMTEALECDYFTLDFPMMKGHITVNAVEE